MVHGMAHAEDDTPQWIGSSTQTWEVKIELLRCCLDFVMVAEHYKILGALRIMLVTLMFAISASGLTVGCMVEKEYLNMSLEAVHFKMDEVARTEVGANLKFENGVKPGYHAKSYGMEEFYMTEELYVMDPQGEGDGDDNPLENEPNNNGMDCKAVNLQAMDGDYGEVKYVNVNFGNYVNEEYINRTMSLVKYDIGVIDFCGSSRTLAVMNKVYKEELLQELTAKVDYTNYVVSFVIEIMGYVDFIVNQVNYLNKTWCLAVLWLLQPHRSYCIATAGLVLQLANCLVGVAEGRIFQFTMFSMMVVCGTILMAVYMRRHVAKKEHVSRISKKRRRFRTNEMKKQLLVMMFIFNYSSASAMEAEAMAQRLAALTEAATRAAMSAEQMMTKMQSMSGGSSGASEGLSAASRILKPPDTFNGDDPMAFASWRFQFTSWLTFGDSRYTTLLERVEALTAPPAISTYDDGQKELAHKLYAVLTSYLRGRCSHIIKAFAKSRDGFAIWFQLMKEFEPTSRQRSLALAQALASYPVFSKDKSCLESILVYEQTVQQFEESSSTTYPDELKVATLMRCCNNKLREFLQLNIKDSSTYVEVREHIMNYERVSKSWTQEQVLKAIQQEPGRPDPGGPAPMEIDRIEHKGKGKSKNKGKEQKGGRGNGWDSMAWGFGRGRGKGNNKGKGKKGKGRGKGKGKNKGKKGQGKTKAGPNQCSICFGYGHWSRECPRRMEVNQVQQATFGPCQQQLGPAQPQQYVPYPGQAFQPPGPPGHQLPATGSTAAASSSRPPPSSSTGSTVRRIFHIGPPTPSSSPSSSMYRDGSVRMVQLEEVSEEEYINLATQEEEDEEWVILDSGSDVSLLPNRFLADEGSDRSHALRDCQGGALAVMGTRSTDLQVQDVSGESVVLRHQFVVGEVTTSLISLGQLYQLGWRITEAQGTDKLCLVDPERAVEIPVHFRGKSFALKAHVRCVTEEPEEECEVRAVVNAYEEINEEATGRWSTTTTGTPFVKLIGSYYVDPRPLWGDRWPYRTTAIRRKDSADPQWLLVELSQKFMEKSTPFGRIEEISTEFGEAACEILTVLSAEEHGVEELGEDPESGFFDVSAEREEWQPAGRELQPGQGVLSQPVQVEPQEGSQGSGDGPQGVPPGLEPDLDLEAVQPPVSPEAVAMPAVGSQPSSVTLYDGFTLTRESTIRDLRTGCRWVGVSQSGSEVRMFDRIVQAHLQALKRSEAEVAMELYNSEQKDPSLAEVPRQPSVRERELHETTHIPYRAWCPHCVATRARGDYHAGVADPGDSALREHPTVQADFFYCEERKEDAKYILLMVDTWTRYVHAEPLKVRNRKSVGEAMARFLGNLGYTENVEVAVDNEPVLVAGMECCRDIRLRLGLSTTITTNKHYDKGRTSVAERMVQTVRKLQKTLILQLEESMGCRLPGGHCLRYWGIVHAAWLYSRYHVHSFLKVTPYQAVTGRPYRGLDPKVGKYRPGWKRGIQPMVFRRRFGFEDWPVGHDRVHVLTSKTTSSTSSTTSTCGCGCSCCGCIQRWQQWGRRKGQGERKPCWWSTTWTWFRWGYSWSSSTSWTTSWRYYTGTTSTFNVYDYKPRWGIQWQCNGCQSPKETWGVWGFRSSQNASTWRDSHCWTSKQVTSHWSAYGTQCGSYTYRGDWSWRRMGTISWFSWRRWFGEESRWRWRTSWSITRASGSTGCRSGAGRNQEVAWLECHHACISRSFNYTFWEFGGHYPRQGLEISKWTMASKVQNCCKRVSLWTDHWGALQSHKYIFISSTFTGVINAVWIGNHCTWCQGCISAGGPEGVHAGHHSAVDSTPVGWWSNSLAVTQVLARPKKCSVKVEWVLHWTMYYSWIRAVPRMPNHHETYWWYKENLSQCSCGWHPSYLQACRCGVVHTDSWEKADNESWWTTSPRWRWRTILPEEEDNATTRRSSHTTQWNLYPKADLSPEDQWTSKERTSLSLDFGVLQCRSRDWGWEVDRRSSQLVSISSRLDLVHCTGQTRCAILDKGFGNLHGTPMYESSSCTEASSLIPWRLFWPWHLASTMWCLWFNLW